MNRDQAIIVLGLQINYTQEDLKRAYRKAAHRWHPDKPGGNAEQFKIAKQAYDLLDGLIIPRPTPPPPQAYSPRVVIIRSGTATSGATTSSFTYNIHF